MKRRTASIWHTAGRSVQTRFRDWDGSHLFTISIYMSTSMLVHLCIHLGRTFISIQSHFPQYKESENDV